MKTRIREIARTGTFGSTEHPQTVTEKDLQEIYESFLDMNSSPIILGHSFSGENPRFGDVVGLELKDGILYGITQEQDALAEAVEQGYFPDRSIGAKRSADTGKLYLHHVAYLGEEPPAIKNLRKSIKDSLAAIAASDIQGVHILPSVKTKVMALSDDDTSSKGGSVVNEEELKKKNETLEAENQALKAELEKAKQGNEGSSSEEAQKLKEENEALKAKLAKVAEKYPEEDLALSDANPQTKALMAELRKNKKESLLALAKQKLPPHAHEAVLSLADSLPATGEIALSDGKKTTQFDLVKDVLNAIPDQVWTTDVIGLSDKGGNAQPSTPPKSMMGCL
ncbi:MAG: hypothetical protein ACFNX1_00740 [Treponema lecithinolyticum]|uniref:hypothetical protein n=1 Tax=Treponema lecithinolyticum TaxID=53418 RepID=UPI003622D7CC